MARADADGKFRFAGVLPLFGQPDRNWKLSKRDVAGRAFWKDYRTAYEDGLSATSKDHAPWYAVPAGGKANARVIVSRIIVDALGLLDLAYLATTPAHRDELLAVCMLLEA